jgi:hypothetical protein
VGCRDKMGSGYPDAASETIEVTGEIPNLPSFKRRKRTVFKHHFTVS